ncbi:hypothetical protein H9P43_000577 [Blastocladiella emersonii ATCC 22665]|nr:hypothetical protein H9P43_000577 [Blastocladiella emersonii ATCC 22665]
MSSSSTSTYRPPGTAQGDRPGSAPSSSSSSAAFSIGASASDLARMCPPTTLAERESYTVCVARQTCAAIATSPDEQLLMLAAARGPVPPELCAGPNAGRQSLTAIRLAAMRKMSGIPVQPPGPGLALGASSAISLPHARSSLGGGSASGSGRSGQFN